jgi:hypothetical protein
MNYKKRLIHAAKTKKSEGSISKSVSFCFKRERSCGFEQLERSCYGLFFGLKLCEFKWIDMDCFFVGFDFVVLEMDRYGLFFLLL